MKVTVSGKGVDVGEALRTHIENKLAEGVSKYIDRITSAQVVVSRESHMFRVDINGNIGTHAGMVIRGRGESADVYAAFDEALEKVEKQLRRYKRKLSDHHKDKDDLPAMGATKYVLPSNVGENDEESASNSVVIAEKATRIETLTVSEAVMRMDLQDLPALLFFNSAHGRLNVVYRRTDGNISWVDPSEKAA